MAKPRVITWTAAPELAIPEGPAILADSSSLWLAYETTAEPRGRMHAVVRFDDVIDHRLSPINDEGICDHPYAFAGLNCYTFNEILDSEETIRWLALKPRHWVVMFKDNTLDILAENAELVVSSFESDSPFSALISVVAS